MDLQRLISRIKSKPGETFGIGKHIIEEEITELQEIKEVVSSFSLSLVLAGHRPDTKLVFSKEKFELFCKENNIEQFFSEIDRIYYLRVKTR